MRLSAHRPLRPVSGAVVNVLRGIPMLVQLFYIYFVLPDIGIEMSALTAAIIGLGIAYSVYGGGFSRRHSGYRQGADRGGADAWHV